jgi:hypothetical protein
MSLALSADAMRLDRSQFDLDFPKDKPVESQ